MDNTTYTHDDMYAWFKQMSDFFKRDDWLVCVPEHHSKRILNLGNLVIKDPQGEIFFEHHTI